MQASEPNGQLFEVDETERPATEKRPRMFSIRLGELSTDDAADLLGVAKRTVERWIENGGIDDVYRADEWAWKIMGVHPLTVWPNWLDDLADFDEPLTLFDMA